MTKKIIKKIAMWENNLLLRKFNENQSEYDMAGSVNDNSPLYEVMHCWHDDTRVGNIFILKPGSYDNISIDGESFIVATLDDIIGEITES